MRPWILAALVGSLYVLHQDLPLWSSAHPLAFGILPPGLWYHALYCVAAAAVMAILVRYAWPEDGQR
jgi:hypothetical protein